MIFMEKKSSSEKKQNLLFLMYYPLYEIVID
jgi:hypothetical protein